MNKILKVIEETRRGVMVILSPGKHYLTSREAVIQAAQKGPTCWWYAYNAVRLRLGKEFDQECKEIEVKITELEKTNSQKAEDFRNRLQPLKNLRENEILISSYRKALTFCGELAESREKLCGASDNEPSIDPSQIKSKADKYFYDCIVEFRKQNAIRSFQEFLTLKILEIRKAAYLGFCDFIKNPRIKEYLKSVNNKHFDEEFLILCNHRVRALSSGLLGLNESQWKSTGEIDELIAAIEKEGAIVVTGKEGVGYYKAAIEIEKVNGVPYTIYSLSSSNRENEKKLTKMHSHAIVIVGAEKGVDQKAGLDYVYFIDPNDSTVPGQPQIVYKITFEQFKMTAAHNIHYCADDRATRRLVDRYNAMKAELNYEPAVKLPQQSPLFSPPRINSTLRELAEGIAIWTIVGLLSVVALAKVTVFCFVALPACMITGLVLTTREMLSKAKNKPVAKQRCRIPVESSTKSIAEKAKFEEMPTYDVAPVVDSSSSKEVEKQVEVAASCKPRVVDAVVPSVRM